LLGNTDILVKSKENYDKFYLENMIKWWKKKASNRYNSLINDEEKKLRTEIEVFNRTINNEQQIIR